MYIINRRSRGPLLLMGSRASEHLEACGFHSYKSKKQKRGVNRVLFSRFMRISPGVLLDSGLKSARVSGLGLGVLWFWR